jgi:phosphatidylserine/phosphatidylglycerophosphate/cardiolipin synthase-like enzyme
MKPPNPVTSSPARAGARAIPRQGALLALLLSCGLAAGLPVTIARSAAPPAGLAGTRPVEFVETRPVETTLGNPALPTALERWIQVFESAQRTIDVEQFYLSTWPNEPMEDVLDALGAAAKRGVRVRLLLDATMARTYPHPADSLAKLPGFAVRLVDYRRIAGGVQHSKFFLVDGETAVLGSQNFDWRALKHIHELGVRIRDRRVTADFQQVFELDWAMATPLGQTPDTTRVAFAAQVPHAPGTLPYRIVQAPGDTVLLWPSWSPQHFIPDTTLWDRDMIVRTLDGAQHEIVLQLLTYSLGDRRQRDESLDLALRRAAARGARVRIIISDWETGSSGLQALQALTRVPGIEVKLSTVPEWSGGYVSFGRVEHCKYVVADTLWTWVGTSNWSPDYFHSSRNLAVTMRNRPLARDARAIFETSWQSPGAARLAPDSTYAPKVRGEEPPPGKVKYGG